MPANSWLVTSTCMTTAMPPSSSSSASRPSRPRLVPADDPFGLKIRTRLALVLREHGRFAEARPLLEQTLAEALGSARRPRSGTRSIEQARRHRAVPARPVARPRPGDQSGGAPARLVRDRGPVPCQEPRRRRPDRPRRVWPRDRRHVRRRRQPRTDVASGGKSSLEDARRSERPDSYGVHRPVALPRIPGPRPVRRCQRTGRHEPLRTTTASRSSSTATTWPTIYTPVFL